MKLTDLFEGALLSHTEEDDAYFDHVMSRLLDSPAGAPRRDHLVFVKDIANLSVFATRWPVAWRTQFFFMAERKPVGFAILQQGGRSKEGDKYGITMIYLQPPFRKQGFGVAFYRFLQSEGINLEPDSKQSAGGAAIWRKLSSVQEGLYDEPEEQHGSYGWWIFPDGTVQEMEEAGDHGRTADAYLSADMSIPEVPYEEAIEILVQKGGVRVATFHGSDAMGVDFPPQLTPVVRNALLKLVRDTRGEFNDYFVGYDDTRRYDYRGIMQVIRTHQ